ncbi:uncharacterized protein LOC143890609 [Tasmannia lanceolata]|uniref:uncharacterized protein LOC143890609 n=1 Tax=Tasmannia lanceolata TaxID=3420 RepID=UPI004062F7DA
MVDGKSIMDQVNEIQLIVSDILARGIKIEEQIQIGAIIEKLPPSWEKFQDTLLHDRNDFSLQDLFVYLRTEDENRFRKQKSKAYEFYSKKNPQGNNAPQANVAEDQYLSAVVSEVNLVSNVKDWWVDTGATRHICSDRSVFSSYELVGDGEQFFMGNSSSSVVTDIRNNLVSGSLLIKKGFKLIFEADKFVITKSDEFVGNGYSSEGLFKLNVTENIMNKASSSSAYITDSSCLWHGRLGHVNYASLKKMMTIGLIHKSDQVVEKCETSLSENTIERPFESIDKDHLVSEESVEPRRSKRARVDKNFGPEFIAYLLGGDPKTYKEAMYLPDSSFWKEAVRSEIDSILSNGTWILTDLPPGCKSIGCKWIFRKKLKTDGTIDKYKARLVAKGFKQKEGMDFFDTYSPVTRITTIRILIAIAAIYNLNIYQMDVKTVFLNGELDEDIYMDQPEGFVIQGQEQKMIC